jgi:hypothetical protein
MGSVHCNINSILESFFISTVSTLPAARDPTPLNIETTANLSKFAGWEGGPCPRKVECHATANQTLNLDCLSAPEAVSRIFDAVEVEP